jgi:hypothetical protein
VNKVISRCSSIDSLPAQPRSPFQSNPLLAAHDYAKLPLMEGLEEKSNCDRLDRNDDSNDGSNIDSENIDSVDSLGPSGSASERVDSVGVVLKDSSERLLTPASRVKGSDLVSEAQQEEQEEQEVEEPKLSSNPRAQGIFLALKQQRKEQQEAARREDKEPDYSRKRRGRGRKPKPKKFLNNFLSDSEGDEDEPPNPPGAVKKKPLVEARKKRDLFDEVIVSKSEEADNPTSEEQSRVEEQSPSLEEQSPSLEEQSPSLEEQSPPIATTTTPVATTTPAGVTTPTPILKRSQRDFDLSQSPQHLADLGPSSDSVVMARARLGNPDMIISPSATPFGQGSDSVILTRQRLVSPEVRQEVQETAKVQLSSELLRAVRACRKSLVLGHVVRAPCLSDVGEESGELGGSRPASLGSRPASTQPSVLEQEEPSETRSRRSVYQASQPVSPISASMSLGKSRLEGPVGVEEPQEEDKEQVTTFEMFFLLID